VKLLADMGISMATVHALREAGEDTPSVVLFRTRNQTPASITPRLLQVLRACGTALAGLHTPRGRFTG
jgi:hypothetical protein